MDFGMQRRPVAAKYGKNKSRSIGCNFFTDASDESVPKAPSSSKQFPISPHSASSDIEASKEDAVLVEPPSPSRSQVSRPAHVTTHSRSSVSPVKAGATEPEIMKATTFEMLSSDDEWHATDDRPTKRRKMAQMLKQTKSAQLSKTDAKSMDTSITISSKGRTSHEKVKEHILQAKSKHIPPKALGKQYAAARGNPEGERIQPSNKEPANVAHSDDQAKTANPPTTNDSGHAKILTSKAASLSMTESLDAVAQPRSRTKLKATKARNKTDLTAVNSSRQTTDGHRAVDYFEAWKEAGDRTTTRTLVRTKFNDYPQTPKKTNAQMKDDDEVSVASVPTPGSIGMTDLRLSPNPVLVLSRSSSLSLDPESPRPRGRHRRVDMLDAPRLSQSSSVEREFPGTSKQLLPGSQTQDTADLSQFQQQTAAPNLKRADSSSRPGYSRSRAKYGRERSYLADMVSDLDMLSQNSDSQNTSQKLASQLALNSQSQTSMDLDLQESSSDDAGQSFKLKSIHELRQAGSNDRNERDLEGLLSDIDPGSKSSNRAARLTACMKLFLQLSQERFAGFALDHGLDRMAEWSRHVKDDASRSVLVMIFWNLVHIKNLSAAKANALVQAVTANGGLITHLKPMSSLVKDRKAGLSKQVICDVQDFEETILRKQLLPAYEGAHVIPAAVMLGALNDSMRKLVESGTVNISIGTESFKKIIFSMLPLASTPDMVAQEQNRFIAKLALSLLQLFTGPLENDLGLNQNEYFELGGILANIMSCAIEIHDDLAQATLHFAISLCNDRPSICDQFNKSTFTKAAMALVDKRFIMLLDNAELGTLVGGAGLDSMILDLACLLNLTEHDLDARKDFAHTRLDNSNTNFLARLVSIYIEAAPRLEGVNTVEQAQILPAFGYLSLLICNLCLNEEIWSETAELLGAVSMSDVVASAKEMIIHMQNVDMDRSHLGDATELEPDGASALDGFTQRFSAILAAVKVA